MNKMFEDDISKRISFLTAQSLICKMIETGEITQQQALPYLKQLLS